MKTKHYYCSGRARLTDPRPSPAVRSRRAATALQDKQLLPQRCSLLGPSLCLLFFMRAHCRLNANCSLQFILAQPTILRVLIKASEAQKVCLGRVSAGRQRSMLAAAIVQMSFRTAYRRQVSDKTVVFTRRFLYFLTILVIKGMYLG